MKRFCDKGKVVLTLILLPCSSSPSMVRACTMDEESPNTMNAIPFSGLNRTSNILPEAEKNSNNSPSLVVYGKLLPIISIMRQLAMHGSDARQKTNNNLRHEYSRVGMTCSRIVSSYFCIHLFFLLLLICRID